MTAAETGPPDRERGSVLVVDVGTSGVRATVVAPTGAVAHVEHEEVLPSTPAQGFVEFDPAATASAALRVATAALRRSGPVATLGIANQRASTVLWDRASGEPVGPGIGWQDLRTAGMCLMLREQGIRLAPNQSATKLAVLLDMADPERRRDLCFGTVDSWLAFVLSEGALHVTDHTNAGVTGLVAPDGRSWDGGLCAALRIPAAVLPRLVDSAGVLGPATALEGAPQIAALVGDQQASLVGQGCLLPGRAKATFGTGGMLDCCVGEQRPGFAARGPHGCFPIIAWSEQGRLTWGVEAVMLSAGTCIEWLRDDLGLIDRPSDSDGLAASVADTGGVVFVPALLGLGTPVWDFGARGALFGITRGTTRAHVVRAVLEGVAQRGADLLEAAEQDAGSEITSLAVDGGMSRNGTFLQALADATGRPVAPFPIAEATALGAAWLAGVAAGVWPDLATAASLVPPSPRIVPQRSTDRARWLEARERAERTVPELSALEF
ncbi:MAG TPA: FGGY-family carbohydrate kinase [Acidimicrobiales bacterium]|nr:FGGY-family carbohydrate kinase [Acidimicrobiales bacterium]